MTREEFKEKIKSAIRYTDNAVRIYPDGRVQLTRSNLQMDAKLYYQFRYFDVARKFVLANGYKMKVADFLETITNVFEQITTNKND